MWPFRTSPNILIISDGSHREAECTRVADAMGVAYHVVDAVDIKESIRLKKPSVVMGIGTHTTHAVTKVKADFPSAYYINMLDPAAQHDMFDMLILPSHEPQPNHPHIFPITGLVNRVNAQALADAKSLFPRLMQLPSPKVAVLIGGTHVGGTIGVEDVATLLDQLEHQGLNLMVTTSSRTPTDVTDYLEARLKSPHHFFRFYRRGGKANPYMSMLAHADAIVTTGDSVRMCSEAASVGVPVMIYTPPRQQAVYAALHKALVQAGYAEIWANQPFKSWRQPAAPLDERARVAQAIKMRVFGRKS